MTSAAAAPPVNHERQPLSTRRLLLAFTSVMIIAIIPGAGLMLSVIYSFTVMRENRLARVLVVVLGVFTVLAMLFAWGPTRGTDFTTSTTAVGMDS